MKAYGNPLRISIVQGAFLPVPPLLGGAVEKAWYSLGREFARKGHTVTHIGRQYGSLPDDETESGVRYLRVRGHDAPASLLKLKLLDLLYSLRARDVIPESDVLVTNTFWLPLLERRRSRGLVYVHVARFPKGQIRYYPRRAALQTVSRPVSEAIRMEIGGPSPRIRVVPYPLSEGYLVDLPTSRPRVILYAGRIHPEKGIHLFIEAFARLGARRAHGWTLRIVGPWETRHGGGGVEYLEGLRRQSMDCDVTFTGPVFDEQGLVREYRNASIFAYPSLAEKGETFGLAVLEAMGAGCAPVVSKLACFGDFVDESNGLVFDHRGGDAPGELAVKFDSLMCDPHRLEALRAAAWSTARRYALPLVAGRFIQDFREALSDQPGTRYSIDTSGPVPAQPT
jgi:glycosyltransferase involved in cell wall biosynthesis